MSGTSGERAVPYYCPFCASEDLWPAGETHGQWECRSCTRVFAPEVRRAGGALMTHPDTRDLQELAEQAGRDLEGAHPAEILRWAAETFGTDLVRRVLDGRRGARAPRRRGRAGRST